MVKSTYIHIPFCKSKCHYCSFVSYPCVEKKEDYINSLIFEIKNYYNSEVLSTLYIGGGTPSILSLSDFDRILRQFNFNSGTEITVELNPDDVDYGCLRALFDFGVNRLSFGCQTFDDRILKKINRRHTSHQVVDAVKMAQNAGFENISLDFIYGLPNQTPEMFFDDLKKAIALGVEHISLYGLTIEPDCYFYGKELSLPDEDTQADMYLGAIKLLKETGFEHYEISNFSKNGFNSRHNLNYWNNSQYYGFGVAAHGYVNGVRYSNETSIDKYLESPLKKVSEKLLTQKEKLEEEIFLGFRKMSGVNVSEINSKYNIDFEEQYNEVIKKYEGLGLIKKTTCGYALTPNGILVSNVILAEFI